MINVSHNMSTTNSLPPISSFLQPSVAHNNMDNKVIVQPYASAVASSGVTTSTVSHTFKYVELDTTTCYHCYGVPPNAMVLRALSIVFNKDPTKKKTLFSDEI